MLDSRLYPSHSLGLRKFKNTIGGIVVAFKERKKNDKIKLLS